MIAVSLPFLVVLGILELLSLVAIGHLWTRRGKDPVGRRILWSLIILVPGLGPLLYGGMYQPPSVQSPGEQANETPSARP
jgi:hypothetical protein